MNAINMVPLTDEELKVVQMMLVGRMLEINRDIREGNTDPKAIQEIERIVRVSSKVSRYSTHTK